MLAMLRAVVLATIFGAAVLLGQSAAGSAACAPCHRAIYDSYRKTPMARSSAWPPELKAGSFSDAKSGYSYRVEPKHGRYLLELRAQPGKLVGEKSLSYSIGSGTTARSFLLEQDGYLYESPVAFYTAAAKWGLAPGYDRYAYPYLTRPALPGCLNCHASQIQLVPGTQNRYSTPPFLESGVACERCHGNSAQHVASRGPILNPAKLASEQRDSICAQCHLSGEVRVLHRGQDWNSFAPGARLSDSQTIFVQKDGVAGVAVTSHVEKLALSACKRAAGDKLWCGTCHDPHSVPAPAATAAFFRTKCLTCHSIAACSASKTARLRVHDDCALCHMPKAPAADAQHVVSTDHSIPRRPRPAAGVPATDELTVFPGFRSTPRDLALAYAIVASRTGQAVDRDRARPLLEKVARAQPDDSEILLYLAEIYRNTGHNDQAIPLYERAMALDPNQVTASVGLGAIMLERRRFADAVRLWQDALAKNAGLELVRLNLARAQAALGDTAAAKATLKKALELNPAFAPARSALH